jgi:HSP20 family molecular chaperone IbpA
MNRNLLLPFIEASFNGENIPLIQNMNEDIPPPSGSEDSLVSNMDYSLRFFNNKYYIELDMPGINSSDFNIVVVNSEIIITGIRRFIYNFKKEQAAPPSHVSDAKDIKIFSSDNTFINFLTGNIPNKINDKIGSVYYKILLPCDIKKENIKVHYVNGVLCIILDIKKQEKFNIEIES